MLRVVGSAQGTTFFPEIPRGLTSRDPSSADAPKLPSSAPSNLQASPLRATLYSHSCLTTQQLPENIEWSTVAATRGLCQSLLHRNLGYMTI